jgi:amino acid adenylation domain-containing protein
MQNRVVEGYQLSSQQEHLWFVQRGEAAFCAQGALLLVGALRKEALRDALRGVVARHEILRTTYHRPPGLSAPFQVVCDAADLAWEEADLSASDDAAQRAEVARLSAAERRRGFDLSTGPLLHASLLTLTAERHVLLLSLPALCADTWSFTNLVGEIRLGYEGVEPSEDVMQYADYAAWQHELLEGDEADEAASYWQQRQEAAPLAADSLPLSVLRPAQGSAFAWSSVGAALDAGLAAQIEERSREYGVTADVWLHACWQVLLWRLAGGPELTSGWVSHGRRHAELHAGLGLFAATLPVRCGLGAGLRFAEVVRQSKQVTEEAARRHDYFVPARSGGEADALYPVAFAFEERAAPAPARGVEFSVLTQEVCLDRFDLKLLCVREGGGLRAELHYDVRKLSSEEVGRMSERFLRLLEDAAARPDAGIEELTVVGERERQQLLYELNRTATELPAARCVHQLFEEQAARTPDSVAVIFEETRLTYGELNARSNVLAHRLRERGVGPERAVAILLDRSAEVVVALLGVLKAGGAYVPLDPAQPKERLSSMLSEVSPAVLLTNGRYALELPAAAPHVLLLDGEDAPAEEVALANPQGGARPENIAYVIFTSGSTGKPKGIGVEHRQLFNYLHGVGERLELPAAASYATVSTFAADLGHTVIFPALCTGGSLHVLSPERIADGERMGEYFSTHPVDCLKVVPSHLAALHRCSRPERLMPRRRLVLGGEASRREWVEQLRALDPSCQIMNHYGPTETTVGVLTYRLEDEPSEADGAGARGATLPLGRPLGNVQVYLLDARLRPVPFGVPGELYIGGDNLARGYLNRPELTAEVFLPDPFGPKPGARMYRTGDLARYLPDGNIEFLGRNDRQVKIRGYRVEPGEIGMALERHPEVRQAVVTAREDAPGEQRLVAYLVQRDKRLQAGAAELRRFLQGHLPDYMIPATFVWLNHLPLTPNGKIDLQSLPAPDAAVQRLDSAPVAPRNVVEEALADVWREVLRLDDIGVYDDFFELGGHSLLIMQIIARVREMFQVDLPPTILFEATTVAELALALVAYEVRPGQTEKIATILRQVSGMSDEDAGAALLARRGPDVGAAEGAGGGE